MKLLSKYISFRQHIINKENRALLTNTTPTLVCSNCTGGFLYHWLGLKFYTPFINLYMTPLDFVKALENFEEFLDTPIKQDTTSQYSYPIGIGINNTRIHFMHYDSFKDAIYKWQERKERVNLNNLGIMLTNFHGANLDETDDLMIQRFNNLKFRHKVIFTDHPIDSRYAFLLKNYYKVSATQNIYTTQNRITGKRYIDQFNYVDFINNLKDK